MSLNLTLTLQENRKSEEYGQKTKHGDAISKPLKIFKWQILGQKKGAGVNLTKWGGVEPTD